MRCNLLELEIPFPHDANDYFSPHNIKYQFDQIYKAESRFLSIFGLSVTCNIGTKMMFFKQNHDTRGFRALFKLSEYQRHLFLRFLRFHINFYHQDPQRSQGPTFPDLDCRFGTMLQGLVDKSILRVKMKEFHFHLFPCMAYPT